MAALALIVAGVGGLVLAFAVLFPGQFRLMGEDEIARLVMLLALAALVGTSAFGVARGRPVSLGRALLYALVWFALFLGAILLYQLWREFSAGPVVNT